jgi:hypothetical protein
MIAASRILLRRAIPQKTTAESGAGLAAFRIEGCALIPSL